jgi:signal transduction histidine kinase
MAETTDIITEGSTGFAPLDRLVGLFDESGPGPTVPRDTRDRACRRALEALEAGPDTDAAAAIARLRFAADMLVAVAVDLAAHPTQANKLIDQIEEVAAVPRVGLGGVVLRDPNLLQLPTAVAVEVQLALLLAFCQVRAISLWTLWPGGELKHLVGAGEPEINVRLTRRVARQLLGGEGVTSSDRLLGITIDRWQQAPAVLIVRGEPRRSDHRGALVEAAAPMLRAMMERDERHGLDSASSASAAASIERRLARLRYDLHDGPQQDVTMLAEDLRLFRDQLRPIIDSDPNSVRILGRLDDLGAQLVALDGDLRRILGSVQSPFMQHGSLPDALAHVTEAFASRTGIEPETSLEGDLHGLSDSQQITLLAFIREALNNAREHSRATEVTVKVVSHVNGLDAEVTDNGKGFIPETTLVKAAREGHLGLVGIHERVRLLGGSARIESQPGGPTVVAVSLPLWRAAT